MPQPRGILVLMRLNFLSVTAWATMATVASFRPCTARSVTGPPSELAASAKAVKAKADGKVNPNQATRPPARPRRERPMANPT
jgi:hypothetical protein